MDTAVSNPSLIESLMQGAAANNISLLRGFAHGTDGRMALQTSPGTPLSQHDTAPL